MRAKGGPFMWKKLGLSKPIPSDSDNEAEENPPPATTSTETPPATSTATGRTHSPVAQTYRRQKKRQRTPPPPSAIAPTANPVGEILPEATTPSGYSHKRPRTQSPPRSELEPTIAIHPAGLTESGMPTDSTSAVPSDAPTDLPSAMASDVPSDLPTVPTTDVPTDVPTDATTDLPSNVPSDAPTDFTSAVPNDVPSDTLSNLPSDLPRPAYPDHIVKALTFNKISERTRLLKISSLPYHPGPVTPRHERVFRRKEATISTTTQQPATIAATADETTQAIGYTIYVYITITYHIVLVFDTEEPLDTENELCRSAELRFVIIGELNELILVSTSHRSPIGKRSVAQV
ncbi:cell surface glycoprotein 1-like [Manihot esculenta]|uniref:cell surface glycoprotein 1-like n=1 Tax=Manihot esculenta TaxID=3983 RepID=UPI001CC6E096|nr:cell surface glycoprotein 1-like [Manihot esculenta]